MNEPILDLSLYWLFHSRHPFHLRPPYRAASGTDRLVVLETLGVLARSSNQTASCLALEKPIDGSLWPLSPSKMNNSICLWSLLHYLLVRHQPKTWKSLPRGRWRHTNITGKRMWNARPKMAQVTWRYLRNGHCFDLFMEEEETLIVKPFYDIFDALSQISTSIFVQFLCSASHD